MFWSSSIFPIIQFARIRTNFPLLTSSRRRDRELNPDKQKKNIYIHIYYDASSATRCRIGVKLAATHYIRRLSSYRSRGSPRDVTEDHATSPPVATRRPIGPRAGRPSILVYIEIRAPAAPREPRESPYIRSSVQRNVTQAGSGPTTYIRERAIRCMHDAASRKRDGFADVTPCFKQTRYVRRSTPLPRPLLAPVSKVEQQSRADRGPRFRRCRRFLDVE